MQITVHIPVPHRNTLTLRIQQNTILRPFIQRTETKIKRASFPVFHFTYLCIVAEFITTVHKLLCLHIEILLFCQPVFLAEAFAFLIHIAYHLANQHSLLRMIIPMNGPPHHFLFRNTGKETIFRQPDYQRLQIIIPPPPLFHRLKSLSQGSLIHQCQRIFRIISRNGTIQRRLFRGQLLLIIHFFRHPERLRKIKRHGIFPIERFGIVTQP